MTNNPLGNYDMSEDLENLMTVIHGKDFKVKPNGQFKPTCYYCGEKAVFNRVFGIDPHTGYVDDIDYCSNRECVMKAERLQK